MFYRLVLSNQLLAHMSPDMLVDKILAGIADGDEEAFLAANEYGRALAFGTANNVGLIEPYDELFRNAPPDESRAARIRAALRESIRNTIPGLGLGIKPLSSFRNEEDLGFLEEMLDIQLEDCLRRNSALGQIIVGISDCGRNILQASSFSSSDPTQFISDAQEYLLRRTGKVYPW